MSTFQTEFDALSEQNEQLKAENERLEMKNKQLWAVISSLRQQLEAFDAERLEWIQIERKGQERVDQLSAELETLRAGNASAK
jgi:predicted RNase H-like nuclease (RuvC/YqgF family)